MNIVLMTGDRHAGMRYDPHLVKWVYDPAQYEIDYQTMDLAFTKFMEKHGRIDLLRGGHATGFDRMSEKWAAAYQIEYDAMPAEWDKYGKAAGVLRNQAMLDKEPRPTAVIAFHRNIATSRGTADMVRRARSAGVPVWIPIPQPQQDLGL